MGIQINLNKRVLEFLKKQPRQKFTAREIAEWFFQTYPAECEAKKQASLVLHSDQDLIQQLVAEIGSHRTQLQKRYPQVKHTEGRPRRYYYTDQSDVAEITEVESSKSTVIADVEKAESDAVQKLNEVDLYPILADYLTQELGLCSRRIDEKTSSNKRGANGNHWLHPDMVGLENLSEDWHREVRDCVQVYSERKTRLWSFEVKLKINSANVRECFFQAVSNSSWANFGYLVAAEFSGQYINKELRMLTSAHGIGVIQLDVENPAESQILIPAREREELDWDMINRLAIENKDFMDYIKLIRKFYQTGESDLLG